MNLRCGTTFEPLADSRFAITGEFPATASAEEQLVSGTVSLVPVDGPVHGVVTPQADAFLVRDGRIVTLPMPQDAVGQNLHLVDGGVERLSATATLAACDGSGVLPAGGYQLFVRVVLNLPDGSRADSFGGPWPLEVR